jgi:protein-tyrosine phosphatase
MWRLNMVDIHSHILPGLDDGARTMEESFEMVKLAAANGSTDLVATPHASARFAFDEMRIEEAFRGLSALSKEFITLHRGCDCHLNFDNWRDALAYPTKYTINGSRYLLVELPDLLGLAIVREQLQGLMHARICPIITHPERNFSLQSNTDQVKQWVKDGCLVQVTAQSFFGRFGSTARKAVEALMDSDMVHFVASDAHDCVDRPPDLSQAYEHVRARWSEERARRLFIENPAAVINDAPILPARRSKLFNFFAFGTK